MMRIEAQGAQWRLQRGRHLQQLHLLLLPSAPTHIPKFDFFVSAAGDDDGCERGGGGGVGNDCIWNTVVRFFNA